MVNCASISTPLKIEQEWNKEADAKFFKFYTYLLAYTYIFKVEAKTGVCSLVVMEH